MLRQREVETLNVFGGIGVQFLLHTYVERTASLSDFAGDTSISYYHMASSIKFLFCFVLFFPLSKKFGARFAPFLQCFFRDSQTYKYLVAMLAFFVKNVVFLKC